MILVSPKQKDCLHRLTNLGLNESMTLVHIVEETDGDFDQAYAIISEQMQDTDDADANSDSDTKQPAMKRVSK